MTIRDALARRGLAYLGSALLLAFTVVSAASAGPANPTPITLVQPDGTRFVARVVGDEWANGYETIDGYAILSDPADRYWKYADQAPAGTLVLTPYVVARDMPVGLQPGLRAAAPRGIQASAAVFLPAAVAALGVRPTLVILAQFDNKAGTTTAADWQGRFFGSSNSVKDHYLVSSYNQMTIVPATETHGTANDGVVGWVTVGATHPNTAAATTIVNQQLTKDAIIAASPYVDFAAYDTDHNSRITPNELMIVVIVAGNETSFGGASGACSPSVWGHKWAISSAVGAPVLDGVIVGADGYAQFGEIHCFAAMPPGQQATIGIIAHEMGHLFGLPDLYDTDGSSSGTGTWSLMSVGSWNGVTRSGDSPSLLDAWSKGVLGWVTRTLVTGTLTNQSLPAAATSSTVYQLLAGSPGATGEYFLLENRQKTSYDVALKGAGLLIWHLEESRTTNSNECIPGGSPACTSSIHYKVALIQADNQFHLEHATNAGDAGDPFPGSANNRSWNASTAPNSNLWSGVASNVSVTGISDSSLTMTATLGGAVPAISVTPISLDFGSTIVGLPVEREFTVSNSGGGTLTGVAAINAPFSVVVGGSYSLAAGTSQTVRVRFTPAAVGAVSGNVSFSVTGGSGMTRPVTASAIACTAAITCPAGGELASPPPGTTLTSSTVAFQWTGGIGVSQYVLYVGTTPGANNVLLQPTGINLSATATGLPTNGSTVYVRLWSLMNTTWDFKDYTYAATSTTASEKAQLISPAPASTLSASTVQLQWTGGIGVSRYWVHVGSSPGGDNLFSQDRGTELNATVTGLPTNGGPVYVRLWSVIGGAWLFQDYSYSTGTVVAQKAQLTNPAPSSTLAASTVQFSWTGGSGASRYWLHVGSSPGGVDLFNQDRGTNLSATVTGLPTDGRPAYVRLWSVLGGVWDFQDYTYTTGMASAAGAQLTTPAPSSTLPASTVQFQWTGGIGVSVSALYIGTAPGTHDLLNLAPGTSLSATATGLPTNGSAIYVRLWSVVGGVWQFQDYSYTTSTSPSANAQLISPAPSSTLTASTVTFQWTGGFGVSRYWLHIGSSPGGDNLFSQDQGTNLSATVGGLPTNGSPIYVRLWSVIGGAWQFEDYSYTSSTSPSANAQLTSPPPSSTLAASTVTFQWTGGFGVSRYWLHIGSSPGGYNLFSQDLGTNLSATAAGLPTNGSRIYVRLWSVIDGSWQFLDYAYTAATVVELQPQSCSLEGSLTSGGGVEFRPIQFVNLSGQERRMYWIDFVGVRQLFNILQAGQSYIQGTYATHQWLVANSSNTCLSIYQPVSGGGRVTLR